MKPAFIKYCCLGFLLLIGTHLSAQVMVSKTTIVNDTTTIKIVQTAIPNGLYASTASHGTLNNMTIDTSVIKMSSQTLPAQTAIPLINYHQNVEKKAIQEKNPLVKQSNVHVEERKTASKIE
jgi:hypothetical protein